MLYNLNLIDHRITLNNSHKIILYYFSPLFLKDILKGFIGYTFIHA